MDTSSNSNICLRTQKRGFPLLSLYPDWCNLVNLASIFDGFVPDEGQIWFCTISNCDQVHVRWYQLVLQPILFPWLSEVLLKRSVHNRQIPQTWNICNGHNLDTWITDLLCKISLTSCLISMPHNDPMRNDFSYDILSLFFEPKARPADLAIFNDRRN